ncbi:DNA polymerase V [Verrucomicrobium sp. GAS474]|uniref:S24 family peptidase n=1 Tax=Verrucomicrobium sp. GAS474 TaxID=1882831 RepID=UPI00087D66D9|nr:S24 family peptidase [Verrucomicrobium sp. GAS474]SDU13872.1 DNA polymerase V [Verrucomicrobium sp. GAS474]
MIPGLLELPFLVAQIPAGFPSPADDYREEPLNIQQLVTRNPLATFFVRAHTHALPSRGIELGDLLVIDRSRTPSPGQVILAVEDGEIRLREMPSSGEIEVWGLVTYTLKELTNAYVRPHRLQ